jgi:pyridoxine 4-dehydrogenase
MSQSVSAFASGQFKIGGDLLVNRLGFGAMRITGRGVWGPRSTLPLRSPRSNGYLS